LQGPERGKRGRSVAWLGSGQRGEGGKKKGTAERVIKKNENARAAN